MTTKQPYPIEDEHDFKGWRLMEPNAARLLKEIMFRWRGSSIRVKGQPGKWAVYPVQRWCEWAGLSSDQGERALRTLEVDGLIRRERHRFEGTTVRTFIQPTELAMKYLGRPNEKDAAQAALAANSAAIVAAVSAGTNAGTDYTSLPSSSNSSTSSNNAPSSFHEGGKGKAHTKETTKKKLASAVVGNLVKPGPDVAGGGDPDLLAKLKSIKQSHKMSKAEKRAALITLLPRIPGAATAGVKHPSDLHPKGWQGWSPEMHLNRYAVYCEYAENALNKGVGKSHYQFGKSSPTPKLLPGMDPDHDAEMAKLHAELQISMMDCVD